MFTKSIAAAFVVLTAVPVLASEASYDQRNAAASAAQLSPQTKVAEPCPCSCGHAHHTRR